MIVGLFVGVRVGIVEVGTEVGALDGVLVGIDEVGTIVGELDGIIDGRLLGDSVGIG